MNQGLVLSKCLQKYQLTEVNENSFLDDTDVKLSVGAHSPHGFHDDPDPDH